MLQAKRYQSHLPLTSTPAGEPTVVNSMRALSTRPRSSNPGDSRDSSRKRKHSGDGDGGRGLPGGDDGDDPGHGDGGASRDTRNGISAKRLKTVMEERSMVARLPPLSPEQFYWDGECAMLRIMIRLWKKNLEGYSDQMALSFLRTCVSKKWVHIIDTNDTLEEVLETFALYSANEDLFLRRIMDEMRGYVPSRTYKQDKVMLTFFETSLVKVTRLNSSFLLDFSTAQQLVAKLSDNTLRRQYKNELDQLRDRTSDTHTTRNYMATMRQMIHRIRISIDSDIDINEINQASRVKAQTQEASTYAVSTTDQENDKPKRNKFQKNNNKNKRSYNNEPINMDSRGDLRYDWKGNPIDMSHQQPKRKRFEASTYFTTGGKQNNTTKKNSKENSTSEKQNSTESTKQDSSKDRICKLCNKSWHTTLFHCSKFPEYIPRGNNVKNIPQTVCKTCLSIGVKNCDHKKLRNFQDLVCKKQNVNYLICNQCPNHTVAQDWMKENFKPEDGRKMLDKIRANIPNYSAAINLVQITPDKTTGQSTSKRTQSHGIAEVEEITEETAFIQTVLVNNIKIGQACCPYEVIRVKIGTTHYPVTLIYDTGAQLSLCNFETGPLLVDSKPSDKKITISTINSTRAKLRRVHTLNLGDNIEVDAVLIPNLRLNLQTAVIPEEWQHLEDELADQDNFEVEAQILVGADKATIFP